MTSEEKERQPEIRLEVQTLKEKQKMYTEGSHEETKAFSVRFES